MDDGVFAVSMPSEECCTWVIQFIRDEDDDCFGLWMIYDGTLTEVPLPRTKREPLSASVSGVLSRTDR
ncbi:hypothetical protein [Streptomyces sp. NPDC055749]